jgi:hypothetical protein
MDVKALTDRYVSVWNEPDPERRRAAIAEIWKPEAVHALHPPEEIRKVAEQLGADAVIEARGHTQIEARVTRAHEEFVAPGEHIFRSQGDAVRLHDIIKFTWAMVTIATGDVEGTGLEVLRVDRDGLILADYQFPN